ncbi:MAG: 30S ribosomal protein S20 [Cyanobacteriota bacterium]|nr:30S ribosomal protein S20 [Cyanobacteriota bacterium]
MPRIKSAIKRVEIAERNRLRNRAAKAAIRIAMKKVFTLVAAYSANPQAVNKDDIRAALSVAFSKVDKAVKTGVLHRNTGARRKSRLSRAVTIIDPKPAAESQVA